MNIKPLGLEPSQSSTLFQRQLPDTPESVARSPISSTVGTTSNSVSAFQWVSLLRGVWVTIRFFWFVCFALPWKIIQAGRPSPEQKRQRDNFLRRQRRDEWSRSDKEYWDRHK